MGEIQALGNTVITTTSTPNKSMISQIGCPVKEAEHKWIHTKYIHLREFQTQSKHINDVKCKDTGYLEGWVILSGLS